MSNNSEFETQSLIEIKTFDQQIWENRCPPQLVEDFFSQLRTVHQGGELAHIYGMYLTTQFLFFGAVEVRHMVRCLFRNSYIPLLQKNKANNIEKLKRKIASTRFMSLGGPAKSGAHLLYLVRTENGLPPQLFVNFSDLFTISSQPRLQSKSASVETIVLIDDFSGSGKQASDCVTTYRPYLEEFKKLPGRKVVVLLLVATAKAVQRIEAIDLIDQVECVVELDESYESLSQHSRYFPRIVCGQNLDVETANEALRRINKKLQPRQPNGFSGLGLLIGFHHNTPNNTLPLFWSSKKSWVPLFPRNPPIEWPWEE